ncbi:Hydroxyacylglutathione hydrolase [invertebrate metagenome]|uniref:hydroxyacylglutathione hydrolase n=1 Tax=invertebrate metagenome TaxID=1711999 RepID=A0A484H796_9ZZZZ
MTEHSGPSTLRLEIEQVPVLADNYVYLLHDHTTGATAAVDPSVAEPVLQRAAARGWTLTHVFNTHHHWDHTGGNEDIKRVTGAVVIGAAADAERLPGLDVGLKDGDTVAFGSHQAIILAVPGHTRAHIAFWFSSEAALFPGDTLFSIGCGRLFEGSYAQMWHSLQRIRALPDSTHVYCAHEYTLHNAAFASIIDRKNRALQRRFTEVKKLRQENRSTLPALLGEEKTINPFLRADSPMLQAAVGLANCDPVQVFAMIRRRKDSF